MNAEHGDAQSRSIRPTQLKAMAHLNGSYQSHIVSSFQGFFEALDWEQTQFGPRDGWPLELSQSEYQPITFSRRFPWTSH
jgi:hypothetical protein